MSRNVFKLLREFWREVQGFGGPELERMKQETLQLRQQIEQLKVIRAERQRREELLALAELRASVQALQQVDSAAQEQRQEIQALVDDIGARAAAELEAAMVAEADAATRHILASLGDDPAAKLTVSAAALAASARSLPEADLAASAQHSGNASAPSTAAGASDTAPVEAAHSHDSRRRDPGSQQ